MAIVWTKINEIIFEKTKWHRFNDWGSDYLDICCYLKGFKINQNEHFDLIIVKTRIIYVLKVSTNFERYCSSRFWEIVGISYKNLTQYIFQTNTNSL